MRRTVKAFGGLGIALVLATITGCGQYDATSTIKSANAGASLASSVQLTSKPLDAALVTPHFGWVLTADELLITTDNGASFTRLTAGLASGGVRAAYFTDATHGWVAVAEGTTINIARTRDGGHSWTVSMLTGTDQIGALSMGFANASSGALVAQIQTSSNFSVANMYVTANGGSSWAKRTAPVAGQVSVDAKGRIWLAGGVLNNQLYTSADRGRTWSRSTLSVGRSATIEAVLPPSHGVVAASITDGTSTDISLLTSTDQGDSWLVSGRVPLAHDPGAAVPVATTSSVVIVADPAGHHMYRATRDNSGVPGQVSTLTSTLPSGVLQMTFASATDGWALISKGGCSAGKAECVYTFSVQVSSDGGANWQPLMRFHE